MKKIIALVLSLLMVFSMGSVAFVSMAEGEDPIESGEPVDPAPSEEEKKGLSLDDLENLPLGEAMAALKAAKFILKIAKFIIKIGKFLMKFGIIDEDTIVNLVNGLLGNDVVDSGEETPAEEPPVEEEIPDERIPA